MTSDLLIQEQSNMRLKDVTFNQTNVCFSNRSFIVKYIFTSHLFVIIVGVSMILTRILSPTQVNLNV